MILNLVDINMNILQQKIIYISGLFFFYYFILVVQNLGRKILVLIVATGCMTHEITDDISQYFNSSKLLKVNLFFIFYNNL